MKKEIVDSFLSKGHERFGFAFAYDGKLIATDGFKLLIFDEDESIAIQDIPTTNTGIFDEVMHECSLFCGFSVLDIESELDEQRVDCAMCKTTGISTVTECVECDGEGFVEFYNHYNNYECECQTCEGEGNKIRAGVGDCCTCCNGTGNIVEGTVEIQNGLFNAQFINELMKVEEVSVKFIEEKRMLMFKGKDCRGAIMGMAK